MEINPQQMADRARQIQDQLPNMDEARQNLVDLNNQVVGFIKANPGTCLLGAIAVGFIVGRIASR
ncbi:hypothetical protein NR800_14935 [Corallococcus interemptor]|jgi:hypothetical protein|uniref:hypothetical protein n=1 Tax=Corallococcus TaxID=83461 RepID=UPI001CC0E32D|nr:MULTISPECIES: hypothetical protein [unclassified Corallococcus]MBZ4335569.1 hypothetical protein [Corallococcus sp. AS-1-12]MBZ4370875.1 hypothetical protein [Corallococcus sp. AS-1-6]